MWPNRVSKPGHLALESDALPTALLGPAFVFFFFWYKNVEDNILFRQGAG